MFIIVNENAFIEKFLHSDCLPFCTYPNIMSACIQTVFNTNVQIIIETSKKKLALNEVDPLQGPSYQAG
jgi:hypothetical protein